MSLMGEDRRGEFEMRTFLPSGIAARSISTFACASTSAEADMLTRKSAFHPSVLAIGYSHDTFKPSTITIPALERSIEHPYLAPWPSPPQQPKAPSPQP